MVGIIVSHWLRCLIQDANIKYVFTSRSSLARMRGNTIYIKCYFSLVHIYYDMRHY